MLSCGVGWNNGHDDRSAVSQNNLPNVFQWLKFNLMGQQEMLHKRERGGGNCLYEQTRMREGDIVQDLL